MDRNTGKSLDGWAHVQQSIGVLLTTPQMSRVMRRAVGSGIPRRVDMPVSPGTVIDFYSDVATAIAAYEPRYKVTRMGIDTLPGSGAVSLLVEGIYYPRGHLGDFSVSVPQSAVVSL